MRYVSRSVESMRPCEIQLYRVGYGLPSHCDATCADGCWMMFLCADCTYVSLRPPAFSGCRRPCPCPCPPPPLLSPVFSAASRPPPVRWRCHHLPHPLIPPRAVSASHNLHLQLPKSQCINTTISKPIVISQHRAQLLLVCWATPHSSLC